VVGKKATGTPGISTRPDGLEARTPPTAWFNRRLLKWQPQQAVSLRRRSILYVPRRGWD